MPRTPETLPRHELIGLQVDVVRSSDETVEVVSGNVVDETRQTLVIDTEGTERTVPKQGAVFRFSVDGTTVELDGGLIEGRPEERILKKFPGKWEYTG